LFSLLLKPHRSSAEITKWILNMLLDVNHSLGMLNLGNWIFYKLQAILSDLWLQENKFIIVGISKPAFCKKKKNRYIFYHSKCLLYKHTVLIALYSPNWWRKNFCSRNKGTVKHTIYPTNEINNNYRSCLFITYRLTCRDLESL
jgi:hypothetical protein